MFFFFCLPKYVNLTVDVDLCRFCTNTHTAVVELCATSPPPPCTPRDTVMLTCLHCHASGFKQMHISYRSLPYGEVSDGRSSHVCLATSYSELLKSLTLRLLMSYIYIYMEHPFLMFLDHTQRRSTVGRTPLDE